MWLMRWFNKSIAILNFTSQLLDIYRLYEFLMLVHQWTQEEN